MTELFKTLLTIKNELSDKSSIPIELYIYLEHYEGAFFTKQYFSTTNYEIKKLWSFVEDGYISENDFLEYQKLILKDFVNMTEKYIETSFDDKYEYQKNMWSVISLRLREDIVQLRYIFDDIDREYTGQYNAEWAYLNLGLKTDLNILDDKDQKKLLKQPPGNPFKNLD